MNKLFLTALSLSPSYSFIVAFSFTIWSDSFTRRDNVPSALSPLYCSIQSRDLLSIRAQPLQMSVSPLWQQCVCTLLLGHPLCVVFPICTLFDNPDMVSFTPHLSFLSVEGYLFTLYILSIATTRAYCSTLCGVEQDPS